MKIVDLTAALYPNPHYPPSNQLDIWKKKIKVFIEICPRNVLCDVTQLIMKIELHLFSSHY